MPRTQAERRSAGAKRRELLGGEYGREIKKLAGSQEQDPCFVCLARAASERESPCWACREAWKEHHRRYLETFAHLSIRNK